MALTLNQLLFIILTFAAVVAVVFLVMFLAQLRRAAAEAEKTLAETRKLIENLNELEKVVKKKLEDMGQIMEASKKTVLNLSEASLFLTKRILSPATRYWPIIYPLFMFFWKRFKKRKEKKNG
jgi:Sec-independent protein translocase protein TatA